MKISKLINYAMDMCWNGHDIMIFALHGQRINFKFVKGGKIQI
jgi:hypothetical protein